ncbi:glycosyltransferase [Metallosphaera tengchongensis]|uniref:Glycosyltransferase n=1 Tax=Metallosphaera tengchongensis TaxID=1532350 RepID=A0A6N0NTU0_9CREN|nr:glycosyltransferase [Metallosphaera tengchongensis]QKQ99584.1 glycosyltransferase [Metallosphaera tengchongensis]
MRRIESLWIPDSLESVWMIAFEMKGITTSGGLGAAVYALSTSLVKKGVKVSVIMPSHGRHMDIMYRSRLKLRELPTSVSGTRRGMDGNVYPFNLGFELGEMDGVEIIMVKGMDYQTGRIMDSWNVYENSMEKSALLARAMDHLVSTLKLENVPSLIHAHDWHAVVPGVKAKMSLEERRVIVPLVYTVHLLNKVGAPWHYASEEWSGLVNCNHYVWMISKHVLRQTSSLWDMCEGKIERFGFYEADLITTVSRSYLIYDLIPFAGNFTENKSCVIYNGTDWDINQVREYANKFMGTDNRAQLRATLFSSIRNNRFVPNDYNTGNMLWNNRQRLGIRDDWSYEPLERGQLVLFAGRLVYQKGVDLLTRAFRGVVEKIPDARLVILGIPSDDYGLLQDLIDRASELKDNVRIFALSSIEPNLFKLWHYAASVAVMPSRWEPFGITAIEAMAVGTPVVASAVGGLTEIVDDVRSNEMGNGLLAEKENIESIKNALVDAVALSKMGETGENGLLNLISPNVKEKSWDKVRENAVKKVDSRFRWSAISDQAMECYSRAMTMAKYRASAYM